MNGLEGDAFILVHWQGKLYGLNASGRCPHAMTRKTFSEAGWKRMPQVGWGSVSVPGAPDGYLTLHERFGSGTFPTSLNLPQLLRRKASPSDRR